MANGRPGDNPYTDMVDHGLDPFGPGVGASVRSIHSRFPDAAGLVSELIWEWPEDKGVPLNVAGLEAVLKTLEGRLGRLDDQARTGGLQKGSALARLRNWLGHRW